MIESNESLLLYWNTLNFFSRPLWSRFSLFLTTFIHFHSPSTVCVVFFLCFCSHSIGALKYCDRIHEISYNKIIFYPRSTNLDIFTWKFVPAFDIRMNKQHEGRQTSNKKQVLMMKLYLVEVKKENGKDSGNKRKLSDVIALSTSAPYTSALQSRMCTNRI